LTGFEVILYGRFWMIPEGFEKAIPHTDVVEIYGEL